MSKYSTVTEIRRMRVAGTDVHAYHGTALAGEIAMDQGVVMARDLATALRLSHRTFGQGMKEDGAIEVVLLSAKGFQKLLGLLGLTEEEVPPSTEKEEA